MKTKFSFLAVSLCLGVGLVFALAACSTDKKHNDGGDEGSSSSSEPAPPKESNPNIEFSNFGVNEPNLDSIVTMTGMIRAKGKDVDGNDFFITKLEFKTQNSEAQPGWVSYNGAKVTKPLEPNIGSINLSNAKIDLKNTSIRCQPQPYWITVRACIDDKCGSEEGEFTKLCHVSSSSAVGVSSSSQGAWVFDARGTLNGITENAEQTLGAVRFKLEFTADLVITMVGGGEIKVFVMPDIDPVKDTEYPNFEIGSALNNNKIIPNDPYIICSGNCSSASSERYLIRFLRPTFPNNAEHWKVKRSP